MTMNEMCGVTCRTAFLWGRCAVGFIWTGIAFSAWGEAPAPWWQAVQGKSVEEINQSIVHWASTPKELAEVERERALRIWDSHTWMPNGGFKGLANRYIEKSPAELQVAARACIKNCEPLEQARRARAWFYLGQARARLELAQKTATCVQQAGGRITPSQREALRVLDGKINAAFSATNLPAGNALFEQVFYLRRQMLFAHPDLQFEKLLINKNPPTSYSHNCDQYRGARSRAGQGPALVTGWKSATPRAVQLVTDKLPKGAYQRPFLSYDATKFVFAYTPMKENCDEQQFFLYEASIDGTKLRQLTGTARDPMATWEDRRTVPIEDQDPCYLPTGDIVFVSSRSQNFGRCHGSRFAPAFMLYACDANGDNIRQLSYGIENETTPSVLPDGRILFTRWEYVDRHEMEFHKLWWKRPDGTMVSHYYGNDTIYPLMISEARAIPNTTLVLANGMGHHNYHAGSLIRIDVSKGENGTNAVTRITPEILYAESPETGYGTFGQYNTPWPINEHLYLATYSPVEVHSQGRLPPPTPFAIMLVDDMGGREPIYIDPEAACFSPMPVVARPLPATLPPQNVQAAASAYTNQPMGVYMVQDVSLTRNDPEKKIAPGTIRYLRFNRIYPKPVPRSDKISKDVPNGAPKRILGIVPVEADGSVSVRVPAGVPLQIQALDAEGRAVLTERSFHYLHPGEKRGCIGCHEPVGTSLKPNKELFTRIPRDLEPVPGQEDGEGVSFLKMVQPVLDQHCIQCHGLKEKAPKDIALIPSPGHNWPASYLALLPYTKTIGLKPTTHGEEKNISRPYDYYALGGTFLTAFKAAHPALKIPAADVQRMVNWLDVNAQCYGTFNSNRKEYYTIHQQGEKNLRTLIRARFGDALAAQPICALVNGARPQESRVLLAPLAKAAGGWEQWPNGWKDRSDPNYKAFEEVVYDLFDYPDPSLHGTCGYPVCRCGSCWVRQAYEQQHPTPEKQAAATFKRLDQAQMNVVAVSCKQGHESGERVLDNNPKTFWHSQYSPEPVPYPHFLTVQLAEKKRIAGLALLNRGDGCDNGFIRRYSVSVSDDGTTWREIAKGRLKSTQTEQQILFGQPVEARHIRLTGYSECGGRNYATLAEFNVLIE